MLWNGKLKQKKKKKYSGRKFMLDAFHLESHAAA